MKKYVGLMLGAFLATSVQADPSLCGYRDYFHLSDATSPQVFISSANSNIDIFIHVIGPRSFELRDTPNCTAGYAHVTLMSDAFNWCVLDIKDGPFVHHPTVSASCNGLTFNGITYDGFNTYSYSINIT